MSALVSCARAAAPPSPEPPPIASAVAAPTTSATASSAAGASSAPRPTEDRPFTASDASTIARAVCESEPTPQGSLFTCPCPSYTELTEGTMEVGPFFFGSFTSERAAEAVVEMRGCETGAGSSQTYAERALVRREGASVKRELRDDGALGECVKVTSRAGRDRLVCRRAGGHQGVEEITFSMRTFRRQSGDTIEDDDDFLELTSHLAFEAGAREPSFELDVTRFEVEGKPAYAAGDERALAVVVSVSSRAHCATKPSACAKGPALQHDLRFTFDGARFRLAPESRAAFDRLKERSRD